MKLEKLDVVNLFGEFEHHLTFNTNSRSSFIVGRNGGGKTTILNSIHALSTGNMNFFKKRHFEEFNFQFDNGFYIKLNQDENGKIDITYPHEGNGVTEELEQGNYEIHNAEQLATKLIKENLITELECGHWKGEYDSHMHKKDLITHYGKFFFKLPDAVESFISNWNVQVLSSERLLADIDESKKVTDNTGTKCYRVKYIAQDLKDRLIEKQTSVLENVEKISDELESKLLESGLAEFPEISPEEFDKDYKKYLDYRERLDLVSLAAGGSVNSNIKEVLTQEERALIDYLIKRRIESYEPYNSILNSLEIFNEIVNSAISKKTINVKLPKGLEIKTQSGHPLKPENLSSGEQQVVILAFTLLFGMPENSVALIDEPELSMDAEWQSKISSWLDRIGEERNLNFILATHSPLVLMGRDNSITTLSI